MNVSRSVRDSLALRRLPAIVFTSLLTFASGAGAVGIPDVPPQSGAAYPPANVMFVLDDSGSMEFFSMPADENVYDHLIDELSDKYFGINTIYYNPKVAYASWMRANNTRVTGGDSYTAVYNDASLASGTVDLSDTIQTYFVPKDGVTNPGTDKANYWRYQIMKTRDFTGVQVIRSEWLRNSPVDGTASTNLSVTGLSAGRNRWAGSNDNDATPDTFWSITVPANASALTIRLGGGDADADLYVRRTNTPTTTTYDYRVATEPGDSEEYLLIPFPTAGTYRIAVRARNDADGDAFSNVSLTATLQGPKGCSMVNTGFDWRNCTTARPESRTLAQELQNYARWYSFHRTRMKVAKAGASEAFSQIGDGLRIGYDSIWNRNLTDSNTTIAAAAPPAFPIPVDQDNGLFVGSNKSDWYALLHDSEGSGGTPLHGALQRAGRYFSDTSAEGPWGPETGDRQISCRQNFAILTTDGFWNNNAGYETAVGDADGTAGTEIEGPGGRRYTYAVANPYRDNFNTTPATQGDTLADVAMHYWKTDLVGDLSNNVPTSTADPAFWQHMTTFGVSIGLQGRLNPKVDLPSVTNGTKRWGDPMNTEDADRIDDLWHASVNGRGSFIVAANSEEFKRGLLDAFTQVAQRLGSASNVTANSTTFSTDTKVFQASYVTGKWSGEMAAYAASAAGVADTPLWQASSRIRAGVASRKFFTWNGTQGVAFATTGQTSALNQSSRSNAPVSGANNVAYLKGTQTLEASQPGGTLRTRDSLLGDIVNSSPFYVAATNTIYVGANDGMLHAFDAGTGNELFAYAPASQNLGLLGNLSNPYYVHKFFVDGPVVVSDKDRTGGVNYLVGTLGRGGKHVYALDVTDPSGFRAQDVLWEVTDADMGMMLGEPLITNLNDDDNTPVVIVPNGINSTNGKAVLFVISLETGTILHELDTGVGDDNGLSAPRAWDLDGNKTADYIYAGDRKGNVWKFDFRTDTPTIAFSGRPMFTAPDGQPISAGLATAKDPKTGKRWVFAGTGSLLNLDEAEDTTVQAMYGLIDDDASTIALGDLQEREIVIVTTLEGNNVRGFERRRTLPATKRGWYVEFDEPTPGERITSRPQLRGLVLFFATIIPPTESSCEAGGLGYINAIDAFSGTSTKSPFLDGNSDGVTDLDDVVDDPDDGECTYADDALCEDDETSVEDGELPVGSVQVGFMPTLPIIIDNLLICGGSSGTLCEIAVGSSGNEPRRASWREILGD